MTFSARPPQDLKVLSLESQLRALTGEPLKCLAGGWCVIASRLFTSGQRDLVDMLFRRRRRPYLVSRELGCGLWHWKFVKMTGVEGKFYFQLCLRPVLEMTFLPNFIIIMVLQC